VKLDLRDIQSFSELLDNPSNNVAAVVRHLTFEWASFIPESEQRAVLKRFSDLTAHLRMVKFLRLSQMSWAACSPAILQNTLSNLGMVEVLELNSVTVWGLDQAVGIICAFPLLKALSLDGFMWTDYWLNNSDVHLPLH
jgi:hypothetical protein